MQGDPQLSIVKVLAYFDLFSYPLLKEEIRLYLDQQLDDVIFTKALEELVRKQQVFRLEEFYSLQPSPDLIPWRRDGNRRAQKLLRRAHRIGRLLYQFPYVRGIGISGSLSKNFASKTADIDFFIITRSNRLWIARTLLHMLKKLAILVRMEHSLCMNYFIDEEALMVEERNIFTATEVFSLMPVRGTGTLHRFYSANMWTRHFFPSFTTIHNNLFTGNDRRGLFKRCMESMFNNTAGNRLERYLMQLTTSRWQRKESEKRMNINGRRMGLRTGPHYSKPNPQFFQQPLLEKFDIKLKQAEANYRMKTAAFNDEQPTVSIH